MMLRQPDGVNVKKIVLSEYHLGRARREASTLLVMTVWQPHGTRLDQQVVVGSQGSVRNTDYPNMMMMMEATRLLGSFVKIKRDGMQC